MDRLPTRCRAGPVGVPDARLRRSRSGRSRSSPGAIWAENAWGRYWGWDPKETWAFITWLVYAVLPARPGHGRLEGPPGRLPGVLGYATFLFNYLVVNIWLVGFHSYAGVG